MKQVNYLINNNNKNVKSYALFKHTKKDRVLYYINQKGIYRVNTKMLKA